MNTSLIKPEAILFDWDETLIKNNGLIEKVFSQTLHKFGIPLNEKNKKKLKSLYGYSLRDQFPIIFQDDADEAARFYYNILEQSHLKYIQIHDGVNDLLEYIKNENIFCGIISNKNGDFLRKEVKHFKLNHYFNHVLGSKDFKYDKPNPKILDHALEKTNIQISPQTVWFVGDNLSSDMALANHANCYGIFINDSSKQENINMTHNFHYDQSFKNCSELGIFLKSICDLQEDTL